MKKLRWLDSGLVILKIENPGSKDEIANAGQQMYWQGLVRTDNSNW